MATSWAPYHPSASSVTDVDPECVAPVGELLGLGEPPFTHREHHVQGGDEIAQAVAAIHDEVLAELPERAGRPSIARRKRSTVRQARPISPSTARPVDGETAINSLASPSRRVAYCGPSRQ